MKAKIEHGAVFHVRSKYLFQIHTPGYVLLYLLFINICELCGLVFYGEGLLVAIPIHYITDFISHFLFGEDAIIVTGTVAAFSSPIVSIDNDKVLDYGFIYNNEKNHRGVSFSIYKIFKINTSVPIKFEHKIPQNARSRGIDIKPSGTVLLSDSERPSNAVVIDAISEIVKKYYFSQTG